LGLLDWHLAGPGPPLDDVAYALEHAVPFRDDANALRWLACDQSPDQRRRTEAFDAYALAGTTGLVRRRRMRPGLGAGE